MDKVNEKLQYCVRYGAWIWIGIDWHAWHVSSRLWSAWGGSVRWLTFHVSVNDLAGKGANLVKNRRPAGGWAVDLSVIRPPRRRKDSSHNITALSDVLEVAAIDRHHGEHSSKFQIHAPQHGGVLQTAHPVWKVSLRRREVAGIFGA